MVYINILMLYSVIWRKQTPYNVHHWPPSAAQIQVPRKMEGHGRAPGASTALKQRHVPTINGSSFNHKWVLINDVRTYS